MLEIYCHTINTAYKERFGTENNESKELSERITNLGEDIKKARRKFMVDQIAETDYREFKKECEEEIERTENRLFKITSRTTNIKDFLRQAVENLEDAGKKYDNFDSKRKRRVVGSIFPEKLVFDGTHYRTARLNDVVSMIFNVDKDFSKIKIGTKRRKNRFVPRSEPDWIRTNDPKLRRFVLYPAELPVPQEAQNKGKIACETSCTTLYPHFRAQAGGTLSQNALLCLPNKIALNEL